MQGRTEDGASGLISRTTKDVVGQQPAEARDGHRGAGLPLPSRPKMVLGIRDLVFHQEVLDYMERDPRIDVVAAVRWPGALVQAKRDLIPDVTLVCPAMVNEMRHPSVAPTGNLMVVAEEMTVPILKAAIDAGARGVFSWPEERAELVEEISHLVARSSEVKEVRARVIAVCGARGGGGATFVATHLAAGLADRGRRCVLVDLDSGFADVTIALGIDPKSRTIADLVPVLDELGPDHLQEALQSHPRGFSVLPAPSDPTSDGELPPGLYRATIALLAGAFEVVVVHLPRALDETFRAVVRLADDVLVVLAPDLFSLHAARRVSQALRAIGRGEQMRLVLNPAVRGRVGRREVERVFGAPPFGSIRFDPAVDRSQARSRLLPPRRRGAVRDVGLLAEKLSPNDAEQLETHSLEEEF
jgi:Flp pilus assembly CpaE family ATPase